MERVQRDVMELCQPPVAECAILPTSRRMNGSVKQLEVYLSGKLILDRYLNDSFQNSQ